MSEETPQQKADRLGVPLRYTPPITPKPQPNPFQQKEKDFHQRMKELINTTVSVCETCGKELTRLQERPCGNFLCPFGNLTI